MKLVRFDHYMTWEDTFRTWGAPPSKAEQERMENAETQIRKAIKASGALSHLESNISIIPQGSYRARTNVRLNSDVDICVCLHSTFFPTYPYGKTKEHYGNVDGSITFQEYRDLVRDALFDYFDYGELDDSGTKAFKIHSSETRVDADVLPALEHRHYYGDQSHHYTDPTGIGFLSKGTRIINWPHQTYDNGVAKQDVTGERYKKMVRIVKKLRNVMQEKGITSANDIASFLIESMVWNVPKEHFNHTDYVDDVRGVLAVCFNTTLTDEAAKGLKEVNNIKHVFAHGQPWTRDKTHAFFSAAWDYVGYK